MCGFHHICPPVAIRPDSAIVIKRFALLFMIGPVYSGQAFAQELDSRANTDAVTGFPAGMIGADRLMYGPPSILPGQFAPALAQPHGNHQSGRYGNGGAGQPLIVLPIPMPMNNGGPANSAHGVQFPGSYMPRDTPLHKYNGYEVCDPPSLSEGAGPGTPLSPPARRLVKITSTRSLAAPASSQPCPIYTIDGRLPTQKSHATTHGPAPHNTPPPPPTTP